MFENYRIVLASKSPRRRELLEMLDLRYLVLSDFNCDEIYPENLEFEKIPEYLSALKSEAYPYILSDGDILLTADTVVLVDGMVLGKPKDSNEATSMLCNLSGRTHSVVTGVTLKDNKGRKITFSDISYVTFRDMDCSEIDYYVLKYSPLDKAGAYGIQEWIGASAISSINGSYYNIVGLPTEKLYSNLKLFVR